MNNFFGTKPPHRNRDCRALIFFRHRPINYLSSVKIRKMHPPTKPFLIIGTKQIIASSGSSYKSEINDCLVHFLFLSVLPYKTSILAGCATTGFVDEKGWGMIRSIIMVDGRRKFHHLTSWTPRLHCLFTVKWNRPNAVVGSGEIGLLQHPGKVCNACIIKKQMQNLFKRIAEMFKRIA